MLLELELQLVLKLGFGLVAGEVALTEDVVLLVAADVGDADDGHVAVFTLNVSLMKIPGLLKSVPSFPTT
jgi:hypothetical protein